MWVTSECWIVRSEDSERKERPLAFKEGVREIERDALFFHIFIYLLCGCVQEKSQASSPLLAKKITPKKHPVARGPCLQQQFF